MREEASGLPCIIDEVSLKDWLTPYCWCWCWCCCGSWLKLAGAELAGAAAGGTGGIWWPTAEKEPRVELAAPRRLPAPPPRVLGLDAAVECLGAGGGLVSPVMKSNSGRSLSRTLFLSARARASARGIHVPAVVSVQGVQQDLPTASKGESVCDLDISRSLPGSSRGLRAGHHARGCEFSTACPGRQLSEYESH